MVKLEVLVASEVVGEYAMDEIHLQLGGVEDIEGTVMVVG